MIGLVMGFVLALALMLFARQSGGAADAALPTSATVGLGFLLLASYVSGRLAKWSHMPRITGYLAMGILAGPYVYDLVPSEMLARLKGLDGVAVAFIALTAGGEMRIAFLRERARQIGIVGLSYTVGVFTTAMAVQLLMPSVFVYLPTDDPTGRILVASLVAGVVVSLSPMVSIAIINETRSEGPLTGVLMGTVIALDLVVIVLFAAMVAVAANHFGEGGHQDQSVAWKLTWELLGSIGIGAIFGVLIGLYQRYVGRQIALFCLLAAFSMSSLSHAWHLETLLVALSAGFYIENFSSSSGHELVQAVDRASLPIYALFFAMAGAKVDLVVLGSYWHIALILVLSRLVANYLSTAAGARLAGLEPQVRQNLWLGFVSQAGVSLALIAIISESFEWGGQVAALLIAMVAMHELAGPILTTLALRHAGELGRNEGPASAGTSNH